MGSEHMDKPGSHKEKPGSGAHKEKPSEHKEKPGSHMEGKRKTIRITPETKDGREGEHETGA